MALSDMGADQIIRQLEQELLDKRHRRFSLMQRDQALAIAHILKANGDAYRDFRRMDLSKIGEMGLRTCLQFLNAATAHATRWVLGHTGTPHAQDRPPWTVLEGEAVELIKWGSSYAELAQMHVAWSRGLAQAECNPNEQQVRFTMRANVDPTFMVGQIFSDEKWAEYFFASVPEAEVAALFNSWLIAVKVDESGRNINPAFVRQHAVFPRLLSWAESIIFKDLPAHENLGGFSLGDFVRWYAALFGHCRCICLDEERVDNQEGLINSIGSTCLTLPRAHFLSWTCEAAGISTSSADHIIEALRLNANSIHSSLAAQPLVLSTDGTVLLSPRIFTQIHPERMLATAMLAGAGRRAYESFVHRIETVRVAEIALVLRECGLDVTVKPTLIGSADDPDPSTPDLLARDSSTDQVLVIEYKHCVPPLSSASVTNRLKDSDGWLAQLDRYAERVRTSLWILGEQHHPGRNHRVLPLLLFGYPMPIPAVPTLGNAMGDWIAIGEFVNLIPGLRVSDIWKFAKSRPDVAGLLSEAKWTERECEVEGWKYIRPVLTFARGTMQRWRPSPDYFGEQEGAS